MTYTYKVESETELTEWDIEEIILSLSESGESTDADGNKIWVELKTTEFDTYEDN
jgi:hypothetical protein